jgi:LysM repeat protein
MSLPGVAASAPSAVPAITSSTVTSSTVVTRAASGQQVRGATPVFYRYEVREGDTVDAIAQRFGIRPETVRWNNEGVLLGPELARGTLLDLPSLDGIIHRVRAGETVEEIATRYGVSAAAIRDLPANGIAATSGLAEGAVILVPGGRRP